MGFPFQIRHKASHHNEKIIMAKPIQDRSLLAPATRLATAAREYNEHGAVNPAVYHASTITFPDLETLNTRAQPYSYGRKGTPTSRAFETAVAELEGGFDCKAAPSGLSAITAALLAFLKSGDHLLMVDTVYFPVRNLCDTVLRGLNITIRWWAKALPL
jgi:cysteine-S-conjugate beta-lyase